MWTGERIFEELFYEERWKVEFFSGETENIPDSRYEKVYIGEIVDERKTTIDPQQEPNKLFNYLSLENVAPLTGDLVEFQPKCGTEIRSRSKLFEKDDVLYGRLRPYLNKVYHAFGDVSQGICSGEFYVLIPNRKYVIPRVLRFILASEFILSNITKFQSGAALPRVPLKDLLNIKIPLPPIEEQMQMDLYLNDYNIKRLNLKRELEEMPTEVSGLFLKCFKKGSWKHVEEKLSVLK